MGGINIMNKENVFTIKAMILYILKNCSTNKSRTVYYIVKTAFLAQQKHLAKYLCPLYEDEITALQFGPVPSYIYDVLKIARGDSKFSIFHKEDDVHLISDSIRFCDEMYFTYTEPDMDYLSPSAIECIDEALHEVSKMSFEQLVNATHDKEWYRAYNNQESNSMDYLAIAIEGGIDESSIPYLNENLELAKILN